MNYNPLIHQAVIGLSIASIYVLVCVGLTLVYGMMNVLNFAHGALYAAGAYIGYIIAHASGSFWLAVLSAPLIVGIIGIVVEQIAIRRLADRPHLIQFLATYAITLIIIELIRILMGNSGYSVSPPSWLTGSVSIASLEFSYLSIFSDCCSSDAVWCAWSLAAMDSLGRSYSRGI